MKQILVKLPNWLGDVVMALPTLAGLRRMFPQASLHALVRTKFSDLIRSGPDVDDTLAYPRRTGVGRVCAVWKAARDLRRRAAKRRECRPVRRRSLR